MGTVQTQLIRIGALAVACAAALGTAAAGVAGASTTSSGNTGNSGHSTAAPANLSGLKAKAAQDVNERVDALNNAIDKVNAAKGLGSGQAALVAYLGTDITPLQQLNEKPSLAPGRPTSRITIQGSSCAKRARPFSPSDARRTR
jgi:hypothetical protein